MHVDMLWMFGQEIQTRLEFAETARALTWFSVEKTGLKGAKMNARLQKRLSQQTHNYVTSA
jgi:hypothetical protein